MTIVEICVDDLEGTLEAERAGADRVEVCANLAEGGTTPSFGLIVRILELVTTVGVQIMIRPRGGDFVHSDSELSVMVADVCAIRDLAAQGQVPLGIVLGVLTDAGRVDIGAMRRLMAAAGDLPVTFHKAFDATSDLIAAHAELTELGVVRILTSGGAPTALEGANMLRRLVAKEPHGPVILAGGSVRTGNVANVVATSGVSEVHLRAQVISEHAVPRLVTDAGLVRFVIAALSAPQSTSNKPNGAPAASEWV